MKILGIRALAKIVGQNESKYEIREEKQKALFLSSHLVISYFVPLPQGPINQMKRQKDDCANYDGSRITQCMTGICPLATNSD